MGAGNDTFACEYGTFDPATKINAWAWGEEDNCPTSVTGGFDNGVNTLL